MKFEKKEKEVEVLEKLKEVIDPELNINIVELGLIYGVKILKQVQAYGSESLQARRDDKNRGKFQDNSFDVEIRMTLTTPGCPLSDVFQEEVTKAVKKLKGVKNVIIDLVWEPMWTPDGMSEEAREKLGMI